MKYSRIYNHKKARNVIWGYKWNHVIYARKKLQINNIQFSFKILKKQRNN